MPVTGVDEVLEGDVDAAGPADPAELGVEQQQGHQAEPEDRHRIADQAEHAHDLVERACPGAPPPARRAARRATAPIRMPSGRQLQRRREDALDVVDDRVGRSAPKCRNRRCSAFADIDRRTAASSGLSRPSSSRTALDHVLGRAVADDRQHRIDRHHAADEEGDRKQAEEGDASAERNLPAQDASALPRLMARDASATYFLPAR